MLAGEVEYVVRLLHEGGRNEVVEDLLDFGVLLQVLVVLLGDRFLQRRCSRVSLGSGSAAATRGGRRAPLSL